MRINHLFKYILLFLFVQGSVLAQVNLTFKEGYIGTQGSNSNQSNGIDVFSTMGISNINFSQPYTSFGGTQGNDVSGTIKITLLSGTQISVPAALNFRETTGSTIEVFGFIFDSSVSQSWTYNGTSFSIVGGSIRNTSSSLGLKAFRSNFTFIDGENRSGNAANASSMLRELNNELANTPQPSSIVLSSNSVVEGNNLVYQITLSSAVPTGQFIYYSFSTSGSASQTIDYNQTFVFSNSVVDNGNGSITVPQGVSSFTVTVATVDDADIELTESLTITIGSKSAIGFIADNDGAVDTLSPVMTANQSFTYAENQAANYTVGTVTATDNVAVTGYSIVGGDTNNEFAITSGGVLSHTATGTTGAANDFETTPNSFTLTIQVTDAASNTATGTITVTVTDLDEVAPTMTANQSFTYAENQAANYTVGTVTATDNVGVTGYSIVGGDTNNQFAITNGGVLSHTVTGTTGAANDFETTPNSYTLTIQVTDAAGNTVTGTITVDVTNVVEDADAGPTLTANQSFTYVENQAASYTVGTVTATDNVGVTGYSIVGGDTNNEFAITSGGVLSHTVTGTAGAANDFEITPNTYTLTIEVTDAAGNTATGTITVNVTNIDDAAPAVTAGQRFTYAENQAANYTVGTVAATDNVGVTGYSIVGGDTNNEFAITSGGVLSHTATGTTGAANDFETTPNSFTLTIQVTDAAGNTATGTITVTVTDLDEDSDGDGVTDAQELLDGTDPNDPCSYDWNSQNAPVTTDWLALDCDGDGLSNQKELQQGTDPNEKDSDGDGVSDGREFYDGTDPNDNCDLVIANQSLVPSAAWYTTDCDGDGLTREEEIAQGLDPNDPDADGDGVLDGDELADGTDPNDPCSFEMGSKTKDASAKWNDLDCDGDGLTNKEEMDSGTDPFDQDSDGDGVSDAQEVKDGTDPNNPCSLRRDHVNGPVSLSWFALDCDGDGLTNGQEDAYGTPWNNPDLDGDGVPDGREVADGTNPNNACSLVLAHQVLTPSRDWGARDCDSDGLTNAYEIEQSLTNPFDWDTDKDGVTDGHEVRDNTNPNNPCSLLRESQTVIGNVLTWNQSDCDNDGVLNGQELLADTDKDGTPDFLDADDDGDGIPTSKEMPDPDKDGYVFDAVDADGDLIPDYLEPNAAKIDDEIEVYNAVTANGDGINDVLVIRNIGLYPDNELTITNRWGDQVYQTRNYGSKGNFFQGRHQKNYQELPAGIYFYVLQYRNQAGVNQQKQGYLYLTR